MAEELLEPAEAVADGVTALVGVTDEGLKGLSGSVERVAETVDGLRGSLLPVISTELGALIGAATAPLVEKLQGFQGPAGKDGIDGKDGVGLQGPAGKDGLNGKDGVGKEGPQGERGPIGLTGKTGLRGPTGTKGDQGDKGLNWRGAFDGRVSYRPDDAVEFGGSSYVAVDPIRGVTPPGNGWDLLARRGAQGPSGGGGGGGGSSPVTVYDDGTLVGSSHKLSFDGGDAVTIAGGIIHVPVGSGGGGSDDQTAAEVPFTPAGTIAATNVQDAIEEVAAEAGSQNLAEVLAEGGDPDGNPITGAVTIAPTDPTVVPFEVQSPDGLAGEGTDVFRIKRDPAGQPYPDGNDYLLVLDSGAQLTMFGSGGSNGSYFVQSEDGLESASLDGDGAIVITSHPSSLTPVALSVNLQTAGLTSAIYKTGQIQTAAHAALADGVINPGEVHFWYDQTDGAATPMWKGKSADGTVVSGSLGGGSITPASDPGDIADPTLATAEDVALKLNALLANMRTAGLVA